MEDSSDDDFGDLYAEVEVQASLAINSVSNSAKPEPQQLNNHTKANNDKKENNRKGLVMKSGNNAEIVKAKGKKGCGNLRKAKRWESEMVASGSNELGGAEWQENRWRQIQGSDSGFGRYGFGFSVPWTPGVDVSNYLNFGFTNDSWRKYCFSMEPLRQQQYIQSYELAKRNMAYNIRSHRERTQPTIDEDVNQCGPSPKFEKEVERQPTVDLRPHRLEDSDVVIRINVQDSCHESSGCGEKKFSSAGNSRSEISKSINPTVKDTGVVQSSSSAGRPNLSAESLQGNIRCTLTPERCSQPSSESGEMSLDCDIHENNLVSDEDGYHCQKKVAQASEHNRGPVEKIKNEEEKVERTGSKLNQCLVEKDIAQGDQSQSGESLSVTSSDSGASEDSVFSFAKESYGLLRRSCSVTELQDSVSNERNGSKGNSAIRKSVSCRSYSNDGHPVQEEKKNQDGRLFSRAAEQRIQHDDDYPSSRVYSSHKSKWIERQHEFDSNRRDDFTNLKDRDSSHDYCDDRFLVKHVQASYNRHPRRKYRLNFKDNEESQKRTWNDDPCRRNFGFCGQNDVNHEGVDQHSFKREVHYRDNVPFNYDGRKQYDFKDGMMGCRGKNEDLQTAKIANSATCFPDRKRDLVQDKYEKMISYVNLKKGHFDERHEWPRSYMERNINPFVKRARYTDDFPMDFDNTWGINTEYEHQSLASRPHRESYDVDDERFLDRKPPATYMRKSRLAEEYGTHGRQLFDDDCRFSRCHGSWNDRANVKDRIMYPNNEFCMGRNRYRALRDESESIPKRGFDESFAERILHPYERNARDGNGLPVDHRLAEQHRHKYNLIREGNRSGVLSKNHGMLRGGEPENIFRWCGNPVDATVVNKNSSGRYVNGGGRTGSDEFRTMDTESGERHTISKTFGESLRGKTTEMGILKTEVKQLDQRRLVKAAATYSNCDMDLEEGQIPEEPKTKSYSYPNRGSEVTMSNQNTRTFSTKIDPGRNETRELDDQRILESLAKMERRRERFKDPVLPKKKPENSALAGEGPLVRAAESVEQGKQSRKRRWGGS